MTASRGVRLCPHCRSRTPFDRMENRPDSAVECLMCKKLISDAEYRRYIAERAKEKKPTQKQWWKVIRKDTGEQVPGTELHRTHEAAQREIDDKYAGSKGLTPYRVK